MGFWGIIGAGWRGAFGAVKQNKLLFAGSVVAQALVQGFAYLVAPLHYVQRLSPHMHMHMYLAGSHTYLFVRGVAVNLPEFAVMAPLMIAVHRFILVHDKRSVWCNWHRIGLFATVLASIHFFIIEAPTYIGQLYKPAGIATILSCWALGRLVLTYPAIALDIPAPWRESWNRTRKNWWFIAGVMAFGSLPIYFVIFLSFMPVYDSTPAAATHKAITFVLSGLLTTPIWVAVIAALASELFRKFGGVPVRA